MRKVLTAAYYVIACVLTVNCGADESLYANLHVEHVETGVRIHISDTMDTLLTRLGQPENQASIIYGDEKYVRYDYAGGLRVVFSSPSGRLNAIVLTGRNYICGCEVQLEDSEAWVVELLGGPTVTSELEDNRLLFTYLTYNPEVDRRDAPSHEYQLNLILVDGDVSEINIVAPR